MNSTNRLSWYFRLCSLLVITLSVLTAGLARGETVRFAHCLGGCPVGAPAGNQVIARSLYTLSYNQEKKVADWVAYIVTPGSIGVATNLSRQPLNDPYVASTLSPADFTSEATGEGTGEHLVLNYFAPLVSFAGTPFWSEVNYLTNMVPRNSELNRGSWYGLEWAVRNLANRTAGLYVVTGPIYDAGFAVSEQTLNTDTPHKIPSGFFKVIVDGEGNVGAFSFPQDLPFHIHHCDRRTSIEEVERLSGLDLFPELARLPLGDLSESLGCF